MYKKYSMNSSDKNKVKVILRIRPLFNHEEPEKFIQSHDQHTIEVDKFGNSSLMQFSRVFVDKDNFSTQKQLYSETYQAISSILNGTDATIFAYGQTGAGKTYTILGNLKQENQLLTKNNNDSLFYHNDKGILPRSFDTIITQVTKFMHSRISVSFYEVYNQKIFDLLSDNVKALEIRESKSGEIIIQGLNTIIIQSKNHIFDLLALGIKNRVTSATKQNTKSSRSHSIFHIKYQKLVFNNVNQCQEVLVSNLRVVDLAGSQKFNIPTDIPQNQRDIRLLELKSINGSLSKLGHCISAMSVYPRTHIPIRDSKLTRILSEALLGSGKIILIVCISPSISAINQSLSTLQFSDRVKKAIFQKPIPSEKNRKKMVNFEGYQALEEQLKNQRQKRIDLEKIVKRSKLNSSEMQLMIQNEQLKQKIKSLNEQIKVYSNHSKIMGRIQPNKLMSPSKRSISPRRQNINIFNKKQKNHVKVISTPPKTMGAHSIREQDMKLYQSIDNYSVKRSLKNKKTAFEQKMRRFIEKPNDQSNYLEKVRQNLIQIKKEIKNDLGQNHE